MLFGVAAKTKHIRVETVARNTASTLYPDHARFTPELRKLISDGAPRLKSRAPISKLRAASRLAGVKTEYSNNAGRYLCNAIFYHALAATALLKPAPLVQFIHVPPVKTRDELVLVDPGLRSDRLGRRTRSRAQPRCFGSGRLMRPGS